MGTLGDLIDDSAMLDRWSAPHGREIALYGLRPPHSGLGYVARVESSRGRRCIVFLENGDNLESLTPDEAMSRLSGSDVRGAGSKVGRLLGVGLALSLALGALGGCADAEEAVDPSSAPTSVEPSVTESSTKDPTPPGAKPAGEFPAAADCAVVVPRELPSGAEPGPARPGPEAATRDFMTVWGRGANAVTIGRGQEVATFDGGRGTRGSILRGGKFERVRTAEGQVREVIPVGDPPLGQIQYRFMVGDCPYIAWTNTGLTLEEAHDFARRF